MSNKCFNDCSFVTSVAQLAFRQPGMKAFDDLLHDNYVFSMLKCSKNTFIIGNL